MESVEDILDTSTTVLAVVVGGLVLLRWRLVGERRDVAFGVGLIVLGALGVGFDELVVPRLPVDLRDAAWAESVAAFGVVIGAALLALPVLPLPRRLRDRLREVAVGPALALLVGGSVALVSLLLAWPALRDALSGRRDAVLASSAQSAAQIAVAVGFLFLAA